VCAAEISEAARTRTADIVSALAGTTPLRSSSRLPGWTRLTVACHLRYGALASRRMTADAIAGIATSFYPGGRLLERPGTLEPGPGEDPQQVVASLAVESTRLHDSWAQLSQAEWQTVVREPGDNRDLGETTPALLAILRLTEVEVHGSDLDIGLDEWSDVFVTSALPARIARLAKRRSNHNAVDAGVQGSWKLVAADGPCWRISVLGDRVTSEAVDPREPADAVIEATSRDLLAMLLGRPLKNGLVTRGDRGLAGSFSTAFPGP
jgi:uncharacterized protein (TIGR03083 family)